MWKDIPGYDGYYQINEMGKMRSFYKVGRRGKAEVPRELKTYLVEGNRRCEYAYLVNPFTHKKVRRRVSHLMCEAYGIDRKGLCVIHKNGVITDNSIYNLALVDKSGVGKIEACHEKSRMPVERVNFNGVVIGKFKSINECSRKTGIPDSTLRRHLRDGAPIDGYVYRFRRMGDIV